MVAHVPFETYTCVEKNKNELKLIEPMRQMAAAGYKRFFFALFQSPVSLQRHRFYTFRNDLGHKL